MKKWNWFAGAITGGAMTVFYSIVLNNIKDNYTPNEFKLFIVFVTTLTIFGTLINAYTLRNKRI